MTWDRRDTLAVGMLLLAPFAFFWRLFVPGTARHYFESGDFVDQFYAFAHYEAVSLAAGRLPLWNPYAYSGSPFWADVQAAVAYPPSLATVLASITAFGRLPFVALELEAVAHVALAGVLTYLFARRVTGCRSGAVVAALAFALGGYLTGYPLLQLAVLESNVWLPLALLGIAVLAEGREWPGAALLALALGMGILAGHPQSAMYLFVITIAYAAWQLWPTMFRTARSPAGPEGSPQADPGVKHVPVSTTARSPAGPEGSPHAGTSRVSRARPWVFVGSAMLLGLGLAAAGWLPALEYMRLSNRAAVDYATVSHGFPPRELVGIVFAGLTKWSPLYVGVLPLLLAAVAVVRSFGGDGAGLSGDHNGASPDGGDGDASPGGHRAGANPDGHSRAGTQRVSSQRDDSQHVGSSRSDAALAREGRFWTVVAIVALVLSLGGRAFLFDIFYLVAPGFDMFRGQERTAFLFSFSLAILAGLGFAAWRRCDMRKGHCTADRVILGGAAFVGAVGLVVVAVGRPEVQPLGVRLVVLAATAAGLAGLRASRRLRPGALTAAAIALIALDLYVVGSTTNLQPDAPGELQSTPVIQAMQKSASFVRVQNEDRLPRNFGVLHELESTYGASPLRPRTYDTLYEGLASANESRLWDLSAVSHVLTDRQELGGTDAADGSITDGSVTNGSVSDGSTTDGSVADGSVTGPEGTLHELEAIRPYAWFVTSAETATDDAAALERLRDPGFDPYSTVLLHEARGRGVDVGATARETVGTRTRADGPDVPPLHGVSLRSRDAGSVLAHSNSTAPGWLVVSESFYPGWRATVDGAPVDLARANVAFMAVPVPAGQHDLRVWFTAPLVTLGIAISLLSVAVLAVMVLRARRSRGMQRRHQTR
jgi:hypothetical protein